jgi:hypothetical protein
MELTAQGLHRNVKLNNQQHKDGPQLLSNENLLVEGQTATLHGADGA